MLPTTANNAQLVSFWLVTLQILRNNEKLFSIKLFIVYQKCSKYFSISPLGAIAPFDNTLLNYKLYKKVSKRNPKFSPLNKTENSFQKLLNTYWVSKNRQLQRSSSVFRESSSIILELENSNFVWKQEINCTLPSPAQNVCQFLLDTYSCDHFLSATI